MPEISTSAAATPAPLFSTRKIVHMSMLVFAFLLPYLTWRQAAGCALLALLFNVVVLPRLGADLRKSPAHAPDGGVWTGIVIYPISVLALILFYRHDLYIAGATWAIMALGDGTAGLMGSALRGPALPWNREKTWTGFLGFIVAGTAGAYVLTRWAAPTLDPGIALRICVATALVGALVWARSWNPPPFAWMTTPRFRWWRAPSCIASTSSSAAPWTATCHSSAGASCWGLPSIWRWPCWRSA
jgi:dolichol kinase